MKIPNKISALVVPVFVVALAGCGEESPPGADGADEPVEDSSATAEESSGGDDICTTLAEVGASAAVLSGGMMADAAETAASATAARELLESTEPPAELADAWADVTAFYTAVDNAFAEADIEEGQTSAEVLEGVPAELSDEIAEAAEPALESMDDIQAYSEEHCDGGSAPEAEADASGACAMLTDAELAPVFGESVPEPEDGSFGPEAQECTWSAPGGAIVSIMYQSRADFESNFLESSGEPRDTVEGLENGQLHKGIFGLGSFDTRGSSVYFTTGDWGGVVGVRSGEDDNFANDDPIAVGYAFSVVEQLS